VVKEVVMTIQCINHHGFRYCEEIKSRGELDAGVDILTGCLLVLFVAGLTAIFIISFSIL